jgi:hypothetical protein
MLLFTNVGHGVISSPISTSSNGSADEKRCPNFSTSMESSMASHILFIVDRYCSVRFRSHSTFFAYLLEHYIAKSSFGSWLYGHWHKSFLGDTKKVVTYKIFSRQALGAPILPIGRGVGKSDVSQHVRVDPLD